MNPLITIVGPTAVGKTDLTLELAEQLYAEVISGDAYQVVQDCMFNHYWKTITLMMLNLMKVCE